MQELWKLKWKFVLNEYESDPKNCLLFADIMETIERLLPEVTSSRKLVFLASLNFKSRQTGATWKNDWWLWNILLALRIFHPPPPPRKNVDQPKTSTSIDNLVDLSEVSPGLGEQASTTVTGTGNQSFLLTLFFIFFGRLRGREQRNNEWWLHWWFIPFTTVATKHYYCPSSPRSNHTWNRMGNLRWWLPQICSLHSWSLMMNRSNKRTVVSIDLWLQL